MAILRVFALVLVLRPLASAGDTAIAIYMSNDCASAERPVLFTPGADIMSGNCIVTSNATFQGPNSVQVVGLDGDCSVVVHVGDQCDAAAAVVGLHECVSVTSGYFGSLSIGSISIHGGRCPMPDQAVISTSAKVPAASATKTGDLMNPTTVLPTTTAIAPTREISIDNAEVASASSGTAADPGSSIIRGGTVDKSSSTATPATSSNPTGATSHSDDNNLALKIAMPLIVLTACGIVLCILWKTDCRCRQGRKPQSTKTTRNGQFRSLADRGPDLTQHQAIHRENVYSDQAKTHNGAHIGDNNKQICLVM